MKKLLLAVTLLLMSFACFALPDRAELDESLHQACARNGLDEDRVSLLASGILVECMRRLQSDDQELALAQLYALYVEWRLSADLAERAFTIQK